MFVKLFWQKECIHCPEAKKFCQDLGVRVKEYNVETAEGLAEAFFYGVMATPSIIIVDDDENEIISFRGRVPKETELIEILKGKRKIE